MSTSDNNSSEKQLPNSLEDELSGGDREDKEKENRKAVTQSQGKGESCQFNSVAVSFLEDIEKELEKQSNTHGTVRGGHTDLKRNIPKVRPHTSTRVQCSYTYFKHFLSLMCILTGPPEAGDRSTCASSNY